LSLRLSGDDDSRGVFWHGVGMSVVGIDGCKRGWIAIALDDDSTTRGVFVERLDDLGAALDDVHAVAIDIPIGLPSTGRRQADDAARQLLGPRRNSVFYAPVRDAITAATHGDASAISKRITGHGISRQSFALAPKILEAEQWAASTTVPVWEVHPEVSFAVMLGHPAEHPKLTWSGLHERLEALRDAGIGIGDIGAAGAMAGADDVLDAAVAAWSAARLYRGDGISLPDPPETAPDAPRPVAIWA
jgi:predicted RNase H-like nuclease